MSRYGVPKSFRWGRKAGNVVPGWVRGWFVADILHPGLRVRPQPKSVDFQDAENRQRPSRMIKRHKKDPLNVCLASVLSAKLNRSAGSNRQSSGASLWGGNWASKLLPAIGICL
ncbi:hypothetical protein TNCV_431551 [Trichonephila clavipes]|nr:hypothetical protein TNCV_431551 [Trichonephila clavipes]